MELYSQGKNYKIYHSDMRNMLEDIAENSIDCIVCDPPYGLTSIVKRFGKENSAEAKYGKDGSFQRLSKGFMGKEWDGSGVEYDLKTWESCLRVLKAGGYLLAFGGSRTYHRIACAIEDASFEIRDTIMWLYGSGFPKSMNIGLAIDKKEGLQGQRGIGGFNVGGILEQNNRNAKLYKGSTTDGSKKEAYTDYKSDLAKQWAGWGTALKPSYEPIIVARKPFKGSLIDNVLEYGVGGINIDECRVGTEERTQFSGRSQSKSTVYNEFNQENAPYQTVQGRFPANTILTYDETDYEEVCSGFPNTKSDIRKPSGGKILNPESSWNNNSMIDKTTRGFNDSGSAARYFYCAKASKKDRDEGLDIFANGVITDGLNTPVDNAFNRGETVRKNTHPTVKPTELMQYLIRLVAPQGATILDPFMGSGSTGKAAMYENLEHNKGYKFIGIEMTEEYLPIANARIKYVEDKLETTNQSFDTMLFDLLQFDI